MMNFLFACGIFSFMSKNPETSSNHHPEQVKEQIKSLSIEIKNQEILKEVDTLIKQGKSILVVANHESHLDTVLIGQLLRKHAENTTVIASSRFKDAFFEEYIEGSGYSDEEKEQLKREFADHKQNLVPERDLADLIRRWLGFKMDYVIQRLQLSRSRPTDLAKHFQRNIIQMFKDRLRNNLTTPGQIVVIYPEGGRQEDGLGNVTSVLPDNLSDEEQQNLYILPIGLINTRKVFHTEFAQDAALIPITVALCQPRSVDDYVRMGLQINDIVKYIFRNQIAPLVPEERRGVFKDQD